MTVTLQWYNASFFITECYFRQPHAIKGTIKRDKVKGDISHPGGWYLKAKTWDFCVSLNLLQT